MLSSFTSSEKSFIITCAIIFLVMLTIGLILTITARPSTPARSDQTATTTSDPTQDWPAPGHDVKG